MHVLTGLTGTGLFIFLIIFCLMVVLLPLSAYGAYSWARKTCLEAREMNQKMDLLLKVLSDQDKEPR